MAMKTLCIAVLLLATGCQSIAALPQDLEAGVMLAAAQIRELMETGAAGGNAQSVEVMGQKLRSNMEMGFGDAAQSFGGQRRRRRHLQRLFGQINA